MKYIKKNRDFIILTVIMYIIDYFILSGTGNQTCSGMFCGFEEAMNTLIFVLVITTIVLLSGGIILLKNNSKKGELKKKIVTLFIIITILSITIFLGISLLELIGIPLIIPISVLLTNYVTKEDEKHRKKLVYSILIVFLIISIMLFMYRYYLMSKYFVSDSNYMLQSFIK